MSIQPTRGNTAYRPTTSPARGLFALVVSLGVLIGQPLPAADATGTTEMAKEALQETSAAAEKAGQAAAQTAKGLWERIDEARLKNRTPDELVAWVIMGVLAGAVAGMMTTLKSTGFGKLAHLVLGLVGAFLGGIVVHVGQFDFGWGPVLIRYEELFCSLVGAVLIVAAGRIIRSRIKKRASPP